MTLMDYLVTQIAESDLLEFCTKLEAAEPATKVELKFFGQRFKELRDDSRCIIDEHSQQVTELSILNKVRTETGDGTFGGEKYDNLVAFIDEMGPFRKTLEYKLAYAESTISQLNEQVPSL